MKHIYFKAIILIFCFTINKSIDGQTKTNLASSQKQKAQVEINPYVRWDSYPKFLYSINSVTTNTVKINGTSWGINAAYKFPIHNKLYLKAGLGYYKYSFNNIKSNNSLFGKGDARVIGFPSPLYIIFTSNKYWYNTISINLGIEEKIELKKNVQAVCGLEVNNYITYSQYYRISQQYPTGPSKHKYFGKNERYFGFSANLNASLLKDFGRLNLGPSIILPVFNKWRTDNIFPSETNSGSRHNWFGGIGVGISFNYSLTKNK